MVESVGIEDWKDKNGNPCANVDSSQAQLLPRDTNHVCYSKFEDSSTLASYTCDRKIHVTTVSLSEFNSVCESIIVDPTVTKLSSFDATYGVNFDSYVKGRQFILVVDKTGTLDADLPAQNAPYSANNQVIIFSGYSKKGATLDLNDLRFHMDWVGVENLLNEIKIHGCYTKNVTTPSYPPAGSVGLKVLSDNLCIFNQNGRGNLNSEIGEGEVSLDSDGDILTGKYYFNNSGLKHSTTWTLEKILRYVVEWYTKATSEIISNDRKLGLNTLTYIANYIDFDYRHLGKTDFKSIVPYDFSLEGLTVLEAIEKIFKESKKYCLYKGYTGTGKVTLSYRIKNSDAVNRGTDDLGMRITINDIDAVPTAYDVYNDANINLNRDTKNIGRVIVLGDFLRINTLMTSVANADFSGLFSTNKDTYSAIAGLTTFTDRIQLCLTDTKRTNDINEQSYVAVPTNNMDLTIADVTADLNQYNSEPDTTKIFDTLKALKINRELDAGTLTEKSIKEKDIQVFLAHPSISEVRSPETSNYIYPTIKVGSDTFYFITPLENKDIEIDGKLNTEDFSSILIFGNTTELNDETSMTNFKEYLYKSEIEYNEPSFGFTNYNITNPAPIWARANVVTDYQIKGISQIAGFDNDIHETHIVYDDSFKLSISYKDAEYNGAGSFSNITNGFINASDSAVLQKIQEKADSIMDKLAVIQNSGFCNLNGVQYYMKIGDWVEKFASSNRDIESPVLISNITFDFQEKKTTLFFGS